MEVICVIGAEVTVTLEKIGIGRGTEWVANGVESSVAQVSSTLDSAVASLPSSPLEDCRLVLDLVMDDNL